jgi:hypothetical protein
MELMSGHRALPCPCVQLCGVGVSACAGGKRFHHMRLRWCRSGQGRCAAGKWGRALTSCTAHHAPPTMHRPPIQGPFDHGKARVARLGCRPGPLTTRLVTSCHIVFSSSLASSSGSTAPPRTRFVGSSRVPSALSFPPRHMAGTDMRWEERGGRGAWLSGFTAVPLDTLSAAARRNRRSKPEEVVEGHWGGLAKAYGRSGRSRGGSQGSLTKQIGDFQVNEVESQVGHIGLISPTFPRPLHASAFTIHNS